MKIALTICIGLCLAPTLWADGGRVRFSEAHGPYLVTVFTEPTPFRAGPVDISVFVQDAETGRPLADATALVRVRPREQHGTEIICAATEAAATNKLFRAAVFELPAAGWWDVHIEVDGKQGPAAVDFAIEAEPPLPRWQTFWPWFAWPVVPIGLFCVHHFRSRSRQTSGERS